jgi:hypothetical protein
MSDEILQQLGFDASAALSALEKIDAGLGSFEAKLNSLAETMSSWNSRAGATVQILKDIASNANTAAAAMSKLQSAFSNQKGPRSPKTPGSGGGVDDKPVKPNVDPSKIKEAEDAASKFVLTWETLSRVVATQFIVRAMSAIRDATKEALESNVAYVKSLAEVRAISPEKDIGALSERMKELSRQFNVPLQQVVEAQYQIISNQFTTTAQQTDVMTAALKASKVAMVDAGQAAEIVAGALNAFGYDSSHADEVAAKLFKTVGLGHLRFADLANIISRVGPVARELGVSFDELLAAVASLSITGTKPAEVATGLRSAMAALFKPSRDLREELNGLSAEQMVAVYKLSGSWAKLRGDTNGTINDLAKLVPNLRAIPTVLRETGTGVDAFAKSLQEIHGAPTEFGPEVMLARSTDVEKYTSEMNKLKVFMATDLGDTMVKLTNAFIQTAGGMDSMIAAFKAMEPAIAVCVTAFAAFIGIVMMGKANVLLMKNGLDLATLSARNFLGVLGLFAAASIAGETIGSALDAQIKAGIERVEAAEKQVEDRRKALDTQRADALKQANEDRVRGALEGINSLTEAYHRQMEAARDDNREWQQDTRATMESLIGARQKMVTEFKSLAQKSDEEIVASQKRVRTDQAKLEDRRFRVGEENKPPEFQARDYLDRAADLRRQSAGLSRLGVIRQPEEIQQGVQKLGRAEQFAEEAKQIAARQHNAFGVRQAEAEIEHIMEEEIASERELQAAEKHRSDDAAKAAAKEEANVERMRSLMKNIMKETTFVNDKGEPLNATKRTEQMQKAMTDMTELQKRAFEGDGKPDVSAWLNFEEFKRKLQTSWQEAVPTHVQIEGLHVPAEKLVALSKQISQGVGILDVAVRLAPDPSKLKGLAPEAALQAVSQQIKATVTNVDGLNRQLQATAELQKKAAASARELAGAFEYEDSMLGHLHKALQGVSAADAPISANIAIREANALRARIEGAAQAPQFGMKQFVGLASDVMSANEKLNPEAARATAVQYDSMAKALLKLMEIAKLHDQMEAAGRDAARLRSEFQSGENAIEGIRQRAEQSQAVIDGMSAKFTETTTNINASTMAADGLLKKLQQVTDAAGQAAAASAASGVGNTPAAQAHGGMMYFAGGGSPRGTDTIPAMLSPGEMVMSASTTRRFASQLTAMNAGSKPSYHSVGGHVTNIGDINVKVEGGGTGRQTARSIANELRRELRRGTSVL